MRSLAAVDETTARLALAGSSEAVLNRVLKKIPWRRARALRRQLRQLPPTPVAELRLAQRAVLRHAQTWGTTAGNSAAAA
jgi:flagellar motor switch protein FliG